MNRRGYTLIEITVALAAAAILFLGIAGLLVPLHTAQQRMLEQADAQLMAGNLLDCIRGYASVAEEVKTASEDALLVDGTELTARSGALTVGGTPEFATQYYDGKTIALTCAPLGENEVSVTIAVSNDAKELYRVAGSVSSLHTVIGTAALDPNEPAGMLALVEKSTEEYRNTGGLVQTKIFRDVYENEYQSTFPKYDVWRILSKERIQTLYREEVARNGQWSAQAKRLNKLLTATFTLAPYIAPGTISPVIYLTDSPNLFQTQEHAPVFLLYRNGTWYLPVNGSSTYLVQFGYKTESQIDAMVADETGWVSAPKF